MRGGFFRVLGQCFTGKIGVAARRGWAVLPRNSGVYEWIAGAARRFSARRTVPGRLGEKNFKNFLERGEKPKIWGVRRVGRWHEGTLYRVCGVIFGSGNETSGSVAKGAVKVRDSLLLYIEDLFASSIAHLMEVSPLVRSVILQPSPMA